MLSGSFGILTNLRAVNKPEYFDNLLFFFDPVVNQVIAVDKLQVARPFTDLATTERQRFKAECLIK